jgi:hypothetical protein
MSREIECLCTCDVCDGSGKVWYLLKGAGIQTTKPCDMCWGLGRRWRRLNAAEKRELAQKLLKENPPEVSP